MAKKTRGNIEERTKEVKATWCNELQWDTKMVLMGGVGVPSISICCLFQTRPTRHLCLKFRLKPSLSHSITSMALTNNNNTNTNERKLPILLFDIMDTLVRDPFYQDVPAFFGMSLKELIDCKHPTAWIEFEKGLIDEVKKTTLIIHCCNVWTLFLGMCKGQSFLQKLNCTWGVWEIYQAFCHMSYMHIFYSTCYAAIFG